MAGDLCLNLLNQCKCVINTFAMITVPPSCVNATKVVHEFHGIIQMPFRLSLLLEHSEYKFCTPKIFRWRFQEIFSCQKNDIANGRARQRRIFLYMCLIFVLMLNALNANNNHKQNNKAKY